MKEVDLPSPLQSFAGAFSSSSSSSSSQPKVTNLIFEEKSHKIAKNRKKIDLN